MNIYFDGRDITGYCDVASCVYTDRATGTASDSLLLTLSNISDFSRWRPERGLPVRVTDGELDTGEMYISYVIPDGEEYTIGCVSCPQEISQVTASYRDFTLGALISALAAECGLKKGELFGIDPAIRCRYLLRENAGAPAFLKTIAGREGAITKIIDGKLCFISLALACAQKPARVITISDGQTEYEYTRLSRAFRKCTVTNRGITGIARTASAYGREMTLILPCADAGEAARWAQNILDAENHKTKTLRFETELDTALTALSVITVTGGTEADGNWLIRESKHDLIARTTEVLLSNADADEYV